MAPSYSVYQLHMWFQSHLLTSVKKKSEVCYFLHTSFLNKLTLRNELDHLISPVHCKSTLPWKFLPELLAIILAWTQGILEVELKAWIWFKYFPSHTSPCPQSLVTVTQFNNYAFELHARSHHLQSGLHFSQSIWWTISYFPKVSPGTYLLFLSSIDSLCIDSKTIGLWTKWTTEPCIANKTHKNSHRIFHSQSACQMLFSFPSWMSVLPFSNRNGKSISQQVFLIYQKLPWNIIVLLYNFFEHTTPIYIFVDLLLKSIGM